MKDHTQRRGCEGKKIQEIVLPAYQMKIKKHLSIFNIHTLQSEAAKTKAAAHFSHA